jgi:hypothetical protein
VSPELTCCAHHQYAHGVNKGTLATNVAKVEAKEKELAEAKAKAKVPAPLRCPPCLPRSLLVVLPLSRMLSAEADATCAGHTDACLARLGGGGRRLRGEHERSRSVLCLPVGTRGQTLVGCGVTRVTSPRKRAGRVKAYQTAGRMRMRRLIRASFAPHSHASGRSTLG